MSPDAERGPGKGLVRNIATITNVSSDSTPETARARVQKIRGHVEDIKFLIATAYEARDWVALGYASWDDYCSAEFGGGIAIPKSERGDLVFTLRQSGMSYRAIESATDMSHTEARRTAGGTNVPPAPTVTGTDGKHYAARQPDREPESFDDDEIVDGEIVDDRPRAPQRRPLTEEFLAAILDLARITERIERLSRDDRFTRNSDQIAQSHLSDLIRARDSIQRVITQMPSYAAVQKKRLVPDR